MTAIQTVTMEAGTRREGLRVFAGFAGLGAALCYFGLSAGTALASSTADGFGGMWQVGAAAAAGCWALALTAWSVAWLSGSSRLPVGFTGRAVPVAAVLSTAALFPALSGTDTGVPPLTLVSAVVLQALVVTAASWMQRGDGAARAQGQARPGATLVLLFAGAVVVSAIAAPGLAATAAGDSAVPHPHTLPGADHGEGH